MEVPLGDTYYFKFTTRAFSTGVPTTLAGTPVISVYEENNLTQITAGVTLTEDYDSVTGLNDVAVVATSGNGYEAGKYYDAVITTGTVGGVSVVGEVVGHFRVVAAEAVAGEKVVDVGAISGDATAADNAEAFFDDTGFAATNSTVGTVTTLTGHTAQTGDSFARLGAPAGASVSADIATVDSNVDAILVDTGTTIPGLLPAALVGGRIDANVGAISGDATAADNLEEGATALVVSAVNDPGAAATTTSFVTDLTEATDSHYRGRSLTFTTGNLVGQSCIILGYNGTTKAVTVTPLTEAPADNDEFVIG